MSLYSNRFLRFLQQMTVEHRPWALKSCTDPSYLSSTVKFGLKRVEVVSQNGSSPREAKRQSSLGPTHHFPSENRLSASFRPSRRPTAHVGRFYASIACNRLMKQPCLGVKILLIFYCQIGSGKGGGNVTKRIQSERSQEAVIFRAHLPPSIFLWKIASFRPSCRSTVHV